jgi:hypothetical protein
MGTMHLRKATKAITLIAILIIIIVAISIYTSGLLQNNSSNRSSQNNGLATYTGYLVNGLDFMPLIGSDSVPQGWSGASVSLTFADGRTFIAHEELAVSRNVVLNETYTVYYNVTQPNVAIDIIKHSASNYNLNSITPSPSPIPSSQPSDLGFMGNVEQVAITNIAFTSPTAIEVMVQNTGSTTVNITQAFVNGVAASMSPASPSVTSSTSGTISLTLPTNTPSLSAGTSYSIKLITAKGTEVINTATYNP